METNVAVASDGAVTPRDVREHKRPVLKVVQPFDEHFPRASGSYVRIVKPVVDRIAGVALVLALSPLLVVVALAVRIKLGPGVIFSQERIGRDGVPFTVYKFRTMDPDRRSASRNFDGADRRMTHKTERDPRHSDFGQWLRSSSLDELPQLFNVVRGQMSLVGPRPEMSDVVTLHDLRDHPRHLVRPGITGMWQISEFRTELLHNNVEIDSDYVRSVSPLTDLKILLGTFKALRTRTGS